MMRPEDRSILLVEDNADEAMLFRRAFRRAAAGRHLQVVNDGERALAYLSGEGEYADRGQFPLPSLLLLDLKMPRKSGFEVLEWLRGQPGLRRLPVVVLTASRQSTDINRAYELGVNSYVVKPVDFTDLEDLVRHVDLYWMKVSETPQITASPSGEITG